MSAFFPTGLSKEFVPHCGSRARGDQCDNCSSILDPLDLKERTCKLCGNEPTVRKTEHFYFKLSDFQNQLEKYVSVRKKKVDGVKMRFINQNAIYTKGFMTGLPQEICQTVSVFRLKVMKIKKCMCGLKR